MIKLKRLGVVLEPQEKEFKTMAKFNAGMVLDGKVVHMVYRHAVWTSGGYPNVKSNYAIDDTRYARLTPTGKLVEDTGRVLLAPSTFYDNAGCQDSRIIFFEGWYYLIYAGWDINKPIDKKNRARVCFARTKDFVKAEKLGFISHYTWDKDAYIFPERVNGKIALVHRIIPNIQIDYFSSFKDLMDKKFWKKYDRKKVEASTVMRAAFPWEAGKIGGSVPPIKTRKGWLFIYHASRMEKGAGSAGCYRAGVALLDLKNPSRVIARLPYPILEPETDYERKGDVDTVVFPVGGYVYKGDLYISYGGADRCVAIAKVRLIDLLAELGKYPC